MATMVVAVVLGVMILFLIWRVVILTRSLKSIDNIRKSDLESTVDQLRRKLADEIGERHATENRLSVEADRAIRYEQAYNTSQRKRDDEKDRFHILLKDKIRESNNKQRSTIKGQIAEQLAPYLPGFKYNSKDARFLGMPADFIVFDGMSDGNIKKVIFVEVKTGMSQLSSVQRGIRDAIRDNRVEFEICRITIPDEKE